MLQEYFLGATIINVTAKSYLTLGILSFAEDYSEIWKTFSYSDSPVKYQKYENLLFQEKLVNYIYYKIYSHMSILLCRTRGM